MNIRRRDVRLTQVSAEAFAFSTSLSDARVLRGELFKESERKLMSGVLKSELVTFSIGETYQINVRNMWRSEADTLSSDKTRYRKGPVALMLHDYQGPLTTSWTWSKLAYRLYKHGMSVVMVDMPGFGSSTVNLDLSFPMEKWRARDWLLVSQILLEIHVSKVHVVAVGESCSTFIRMMQHCPGILELEHVCFNPSVNMSDIFLEDIGGIPCGAGPNWRTIVHSKCLERMKALVEKCRTRTWVLVNPSTPSYDAQTSEDLLSMSGSGWFKNIVYTDVIEAEICMAKIGADVPIPFLFLCRALQAAIAGFLFNRNTHNTSALALEMGSFPLYNRELSSAQKRTRAKSPGESQDSGDESWPRSRDHVGELARSWGFAEPSSRPTTGLASGSETWQSRLNSRSGSRTGTGAIHPGTGPLGVPDPGHELTLVPGSSQGSLAIQADSPPLESRQNMSRRFSMMATTEAALGQLPPDPNISRKEILSQHPSGVVSDIQVIKRFAQRKIAAIEASRLEKPDLITKVDNNLPSRFGTPSPPQSRENPGGLPMQRQRTRASTSGFAGPQMGLTLSLARSLSRGIMGSGSLLPAHRLSSTR